MIQSLRIKLIAPFLLGTLALTLILSVYTYNSARKAVEDATMLISEAKTDHVVSSMSLLMKSLTSSIQNMVVDQHVTRLFAKGDVSEQLAETISWLEIIAQNNDYYRDILIVDTAGVCIASSNPGQIGNVYANRSHVKIALQGQFALENPSVGKVTKKFSVFGAGPIDVSGQIVGALIMVNDFPKIVDYENTGNLDKMTLSTAMLSPDGLFVSHIDKSIMGNNKTLFPDLYEQLAAVGERGEPVQYELNGKQYVGYAKVEPVIKWLVVTSGEEREVFASAYRVGIIVFGISFAFLCIISFIVIRTANGILQALISLINYAKQVSEGNLDQRLEHSKRKDELGILNAALRRLVESLHTMLEETKAASKMKGEFLANMSHEIRTPLNAILGMAHLSLRDSSISAKQRDYLDKIQTAARSLLGIISDILDISKVEAGKMELDKAPFNLHDSLRNVVSMHMSAAAVKAIDLEFSYAPSAERAFIGDEGRINQVVNNLLSNAIKFTPQGQVKVHCWQSGGTVVCEDENKKLARMCVSVTDSGIGMSAETVQKLFTPFTQADSSITRKFGGTGLGLAISLNLAALMDGGIDIQSQPEHGSTFTFTFTLEVDPAGGVSNTEEVPIEHAFSQLNLAGKRLLVAEDNVINQLIMQELIEPTGAEIALVENGVEAVEAVKNNKFDLVFMDMQMPVMDGLEATRQIREFINIDNLPIVAVTANAMKEDKEKGFDSGMNDYITKPVEPDQLLEVLKKWL